MPTLFEKILAAEKLANEQIRQHKEQQSDLEYRKAQLDIDKAQQTLAEKRYKLELFESQNKVLGGLNPPMTLTPGSSPIEEGRFPSILSEMEQNQQQFDVQSLLQNVQSQFQPNLPGIESPETGAMSITPATTIVPNQEVLLGRRLKEAQIKATEELGKQRQTPSASEVEAQVLLRLINKYGDEQGWKIFKGAGSTTKEPFGLDEALKVKTDYLLRPGNTAKPLVDFYKVIRPNNPPLVDSLMSADFGIPENNIKHLIQYKNLNEFDSKFLKPLKSSMSEIEYKEALKQAQLFYSKRPK